MTILSDLKRSGTGTLESIRYSCISIMFLSEYLRVGSFKKLSYRCRQFHNVFMGLRLHSSPYVKLYS